MLYQRDSAGTETLLRRETGRRESGRPPAGGEPELLSALATARRRRPWRLGSNPAHRDGQTRQQVGWWVPLTRKSSRRRRTRRGTWAEEPMPQSSVCSGESNLPHLHATARTQQSVLLLCCAPRPGFDRRPGRHLATEGREHGAGEATRSSHGSARRAARAAARRLRTRRNALLGAPAASERQGGAVG